MRIVIGIHNDPTEVIGHIYHGGNDCRTIGVINRTCQRLCGRKTSDWALAQSQLFGSNRV